MAKVSHFPTYQIRCILGTIFALVVADGLLTNFLVSEGLGREWNPFLQILVGEQNFLFIKIAGVFLSVLILWDIYRRLPKVAFVLSSAITVIYTIILYWNLLLVFSASLWAS